MLIINVHFSSHATPRVNHYLETPEGEAFRDCFATWCEQTLGTSICFPGRHELKRKHSGAAFTLDVTEAYACVHGLPIDNYRPRLPPVHSIWTEERTHVIQVLEDLGGIYNNQP